jgi:hypothetical protein
MTVLLTKACILPIHTSEIVQHSHPCLLPCSRLQIPEPWFNLWTWAAWWKFLWDCGFREPPHKSLFKSGLPTLFMLCYTWKWQYLSMVHWNKGKCLLIVRGCKARGTSHWKLYLSTTRARQSVLSPPVIHEHWPLQHADLNYSGLS